MHRHHHEKRRNGIPFPKSLPGWRAMSAQASPRKKKKRDSFPQIPTWLEGHVKERKQKRLPTVTLCSSAGNELLEVWYYGELLTVKGESQSYIIDRGETPGLVAARDPESGEEFVIFDGGQHGYDNMFCDEHNPAQLAHRPLKRYEIPASKLVLELGYNIDYEDEKESFEVDEADTVELVRCLGSRSNGTALTTLHFTM